MSIWDLLKDNLVEATVDGVFALAGSNTPPPPATLQTPPMSLATNETLSTDAIIKCAAAQIAECQYRLAEKTERGNGVAEDVEAARRLYELAYRNGYQKASEAILRLSREVPRTGEQVSGNSETKRVAIKESHDDLVTEQENKPKYIGRLDARITIDENGKVQDIKWRTPGPIIEQLQKQLTPVVKSWDFEPGMLNGVPAITKTGLHLTVAFAESKTKSISTSIIDATTGISPLGMAPAPVYPDYLRSRRISAWSEIILNIDESGDVLDARISQLETSAPFYENQVRTALEESTDKAVKSWHFQPEVVGGFAKKSRVRVPISYCMQDSWCRKAAANRKSGQPEALESAATLKTPLK